MTSGADDVPQASKVGAVGNLIDGKYRVVGILGEGGMGVVLDAVHEQLRTPVAVKLLRAFSQDPVVLARFLREARAAAGLQSDHVVKVFDVGTLDSGAPFMVLERLSGEDLAQVLAQEGPLPVDAVADYVLQACEGLAEAHAMGIVHRDLKPANLFRVVRKDGSRVIKILDFGISKEMQPAEGSLTATAQAMGSPYYMSPEQVRSAKDVDLRTDIWALGVIVHELLTRTAPFAGDTLGSVFAAIVADPPASVRASRADVPPGIEQVIARCLAKQAARRYPSVGALARDLAPFTRKGADALDRILQLTRETGSPIDVLAATASQPLSGVPSTVELLSANGPAIASAGGADTTPMPILSSSGSLVHATGGAWGATQPSHAGATTRRNGPIALAAGVGAVAIAAAVWFGRGAPTPAAAASEPTASAAQTAALPTAAAPTSAPAAALPAMVSSVPSGSPTAVDPPAASAPPAAESAQANGATHTPKVHGPSKPLPATPTPSKSNEAYDDRQ